MKHFIIRVLATTGITLEVLAIIGTLYGASVIFIGSVFQSVGANLIIHLGFLLTHRFESKFILLESALDIGYTVIVLILLGAVFGWYDSTPVWILALMAVVIYFTGFFFNMFRAREEIKKINQLLQNRNKKNT